MKKSKDNPAFLEQQKQSLSGTGGVSFIRRLKNNKKLTKSLILLIVILALATAYVLIKPGNKQPAIPSTNIVCSGEILTEAAKNLNPLNAKSIEELAKTVVKIEALTSYDTDQNCLYPVVWHYIFTTDTAKAQQGYDKLTIIYDEASLSMAYTYRTSLDDMRKQINGLQQYEKDAASNTIYITPQEGTDQ